MIGHQFGHYRVVERIGAGSMGEVYRARDERLDREVAIKVLTPEALGDEIARKRFRQEALALSRIQHPGIAVIHDFDTQDGIDFLVMEYIPGRSLGELLAAGPLPLAQIVDLGTQLADALDHAHAAGVIHRDLKPANLRLMPDGRLKVLDFGIARRAVKGEDLTRTNVVTGSPLGTLPYMSPEQLTGAVVDERTDVYAAGAVLYELTTGTRVFPEQQQALLIDAILRRPPEPPRKVRPDTPAALEALVLKCLDKSARLRYQSAQELKTDLLRVLERGDAAITGTSTRRRRVRWAVGATAAAIAVASLWSFGGWTPPAEEAVGVEALAPLRLAILPVRSVQGAAPIEWSSIVQTLFASELTGMEQVGVVDPLSLESRLRETFGPDAPAATMIQLLRTEGIAFAIEPRVLRAGASHQLGVNLIEASSGEIRFSRSVTVADDALATAVSQLSTEIITYLQQGEGLLARRELRPWVSGRTQNLDAVRELALATQALYSYRLGEIEPHLRRAIEHDAEFIAPRLWLITGLVGRGLTAEAKEEYVQLQRLQARASPFEKALIDFVDALIRRDSPAQVQALETALRYSPGNNIILMNLGGLVAASGDFERALDYLQPLARDRWAYPPLYPYYGVCAVATGRIDEAREVLQASLRLPASDPSVFLLLEALELARGDRAAANRYLTEGREQARRLGRASASSSPTLVRVYDMLGTRLFEAGELSRAEDLFARALVEQPDHARAILMLGRIFDARGDRRQAVEKFTRYLELNPEGADSDIVRNRLLGLTRR